MMGLCSLLVSLAAQAQRAAVQGSVAGSGGAAVEFATITLHRAADSVVVKSEFSDSKGAFQLEAVAGKVYRVSVAQVGYGRYWSPAFELPAAGLKLPAVQLAAGPATTLQGVTVTGQRALYEHRADRTVVNVAESALAAGATTLDVLGRAPGVSLGVSDELSLRGRQGLLVVIDGKRTPLTGAELADYLRALPAGQLQTIELITNPPASYDAQGGAGVIDIKLKKDQRLGTNGTFTASYGRSEDGKLTAGLTLNHRRQLLNAYGSYTFSDRRYFKRTDFDREFRTTPAHVSGRSVQADDQVSQLYSHAGKVGLDLTLSQRTLLGVSATGLMSRVDNNVANQTQVYKYGGQLASAYQAAVFQNIDRPSGSANLNLQHAFADSAGAATLSADADYARYYTSRLLALNTYFTDLSHPDNLRSGDQRSTLSVGAVKVDFSQPLPHRAHLDAGAKVTRITSDNDVAFFDTWGGQTMPLPGISSQFSYHENVNAAYASLRGSLPNTTWQAGLRAEQTNTLAEKPGVTLQDLHYLQWFPSALLERALGARHALTLALARRLDRPSYFQVNPLRAYFDATSYAAGNPLLLPQTSYNAELTHTYRQKFSTALAYAHTDQPIINVVQPSPDGNGVVVTQDVNLTAQNFYTLTLTASPTLTKWWTVYAQGILYYNQFTGFVGDTYLDRGGLAGKLTANNTFTLPGGWTAELNGFYESSQKFNYQTIQPRGQVSAGLQKNVWGKQGTLRLSVTDIFYTMPFYVTSTYDNFVESYGQRLDTRVVTAAFTYRFGNGKVAAARKRAAGAEDELQRAGGGQ